MQLQVLSLCKTKASAELIKQEVLFYWLRQLVCCVLILLLIGEHF